MSKLDITSKRVNLTGVLQLKDAEDNLMFSDGADGAKIPVTVTLFSPGSREYAQAGAKRSNRNLERLRKKGKVKIGADDTLAEGAEYLADITSHFSDNFAFPPAEGSSGRELHLAVYGDREIGFIADQVAEYVGDWANFSKGSATS
jgi:hypothetical protein